MIPVNAPMPFVIPISVPAKFGDKSNALTFIPTVMKYLIISN